MSFDLKAQIGINAFTLVELSQKEEEVSQFVTLVDVVMEVLELVENLTEGSHDDRKECDTEQKNECSEQPLSVAARMVVTESHS